MSVQGKTLLLTGVTSGLGRGMVPELVRRGMKVVGTGRRADLGAELEKEVDSENFRFFRADVSRVADCEASVNAVVETYGRLDCLINNAGYEGADPFIDFHTATEEHYDSVVDVNLKGAFFCCRYAIAHMMERGGGGSVLNISSINAVNGPAHMPAYSASKAGLLRLSTTLADEYMPHNIRVNAVVLGTVNVGDTNQRTQDAIARYVRGADYVRPGNSATGNYMDQTAEEIASACALLLSDDAKAITGACVPMDKAMTVGLTTTMVTLMTTSGLWSTAPA